VRDALQTLVAAALWGLVAGLGAASLSVAAGVAAAVLGSVLGVLLARAAAASRLRLWAVWVSAGGLLLASLLTARLTVALSLPASLLGPSAAFRLGEVLTWFGVTVALLGALHASSRRHPVFMVLELLLAGGLLAGLLAAHRDGFVNRPHQLVDRLWGSGFDPVPVFLGAGAAVAALLLALATVRGSRRRPLADAAILALAVAIAFLLVPVGTLTGLAVPPPATGTGAGDGDGARPRGGGDRGQGDDPLDSFADFPGRPGEQAVAVLLLHDDYDPPLGYFYLRQTAFSQFNGRRLVQDTTGRADTDLVELFPAAPLRLPPLPADPAMTRPLDTTLALLAQHPTPFALVNPRQVEPAPNPDPTRFVRALKVRSTVLAPDLPGLDRVRLGSDAWDADVLAHFTAPPNDPRYAVLAGEAVARLPDRLAGRAVFEALAIQLWLGENGVYSRRTSHDGAEDPLADFLFGDRTGHCVYFAHAAALLLRSRGIPARVGAGYAVDARNRGSGSALLVRGRDAHAWPEIYLEGAGWVPFDIAPARTLDEPDTGPDRSLQQMLGEMARGQPPPLEQPPPGGGDLQRALRGLAKALLAAAAVLAVAAAVALFAVKLWRRLAPRWCAERRLPTVAYRAALDRLADSGRVRGFGQTREAFAAGFAEISPAFSELTRRHLEAALGTRVEPTARAHYLALSVRIAADLARVTPLHRRLLGALDPFSWLRVR